jgi:peptidoglycan/xylan/chitin deacetylase (PgdA/CDA1 family)
MFYAQNNSLVKGLKSSAKTLLSGLSSLLSISQLVKLSGKKVFLPFYHIVAEESPRLVNKLYAVRNSKLFEKDLDFLLKNFQPVDLQTLISVNSEPEIIKKPLLHLSFDDGLSACYDTIAPILLRKGVPATFFLNPAFIDNKALMFRYKISLCLNALDTVSEKLGKEARDAAKNFFSEKKIEFAHYNENQLIDLFASDYCGLNFDDFLKIEKPYLSTEQIFKLLKNGFTIGSHSMDHPLYHKISLEEQIRQTIDSQNYISDNFNIDYKVFAFPFTDFGVKKSFFDKILKDEKFDLCFGGAGLKNDLIPNSLQRFPMESQTIYSAETMVKSEYIYYLAKKSIGKHILKRD